MSSLPVFNQWTPVDGCLSGGAQAMLPISEAIAVSGVNMLAPLSQTQPRSPMR